ncbi:MAG: M48 family metalloprotease [Planctomycetota bacterium]
MRGNARLGMMAVAVVAVTAASGCGFNLLTTQDEIALGRRIAADVEKKADLYHHPATVAYVQEIGSRIARVSDRQDVIYHYKLVDDHETVNAFALPGGWIYLYTGLLRLADNEAELASVIAHETGHVAAHHSAEHLSTAIGIDLLLGLALGQNPGLAAGLGSEVLKGVGFSQMSQRDEYEADELGLKYMKRAGYDPGAAVAFLRKLNEQHERRAGGLTQLFATHPLTEDRIARVQAMANTLGRGGRIGADVYQRRLAHLLAQSGPPSGDDEAPRPAAPEADPTAMGGGVLGAPAARAVGRMTARRTESPMICRNLTKGNVVASRLELATTPAARRKGLLGRSGLPPGGGLLLIPCNSVHTVRMKFPIDIVFLDKKMRVLRLYPKVDPGALSRHCVKARSCLELPAGTIEARRIERGDQLRVMPPKDKKTQSKG